jgi:formiminoglutamase
VSALSSLYRAPDAAARARWTGRVDGDEPEVQRWHQGVQFVDLALGLEHCFDPTVCLIGYASDLGVRMNLGRLGAAEGPSRLRARMASLPMIAGVSVLDCGDIVAGESVLDTQQALAGAVERIVRAGALPVILGGGHDQAFGHFLGIARATGTPPACVNFDAHLDLRPIPADGPNSGTPFTQAWEWCKARQASFRYAALGVQRAGNTSLLFARAEHAGATLIDADGFAIDTLDVVMEAISDTVDEAEIALSVDLDVFAAAFAPGVSAPTAMGVAPDSAFRRLFRGLMASGRVRGVEIAELCPPLDIDDRTARLGAAIAFEAALGLLDALESGDDAEGDVDGEMGADIDPDLDPDADPDADPGADHGNDQEGEDRP